MTDSPIERGTRTLSRLRSRRGVLVAIGAVFGATVPGRIRAQLEPPSCSPEGEVCTQLVSCCTGLVCATSTINTNYGVCIPGEGEVVPVTSALVTPGDEEIVTELGAELAQVAATEPVDLHAERVAMLSPRRSKRDARHDRKRAKRTARRQRQRARHGGT